MSKVNFKGIRKVGFFMTGAIGGYASDPYFMAAYSSPNTQYYQMMQQMYAAQSQQAAATNTATSATTPAFQGTAAIATDAAPKEEKSSSNAGWWILGAAATIAAGAYCYKRGDGKGFQKIIDGAKKIFSSSKDKVQEVLKNNKTPKEFTVNDQKLCTVPNRTNYMRKGDVAGELTKIGVSSAAPALTRVVDGKTVLGEGVKLRDYTFTDAGNVFRVKKGKVVSYTNSAGENVLARYTHPVESTDVTYQKKIKDLIAKFNSGENLDKVSNIQFSHSANGTSRLFSMGKITETPQLQCAASNQFNIGSKAVTAYRAKNESVDKALKAFSDGKKDGLAIAQAEYVSPSLGTFKIQNGDVTGITVGGRFYPKGSEDFISMEYHNKEAFKNVLEHKDEFTNIIYKVA